LGRLSVQPVTDEEWEIVMELAVRVDSDSNSQFAVGTSNYIGIHNYKFQKSISVSGVLHLAINKSFP
jgi:hypothetical protein